VGSVGVTPLVNRQHLLLSLLDALGGHCGNRDFQEFLFLFSQENPTAGLYEFVPCKYGALSFTSYADRREMVTAALLLDTEASWEITDKGRSVIRPGRHTPLEGFVREFGHLRQESLVRETYRRHPWFATRSELANVVFADEPDALRRIDEARAVGVHASLLSIGYQGRSLEGYLNELLRAGASQLIDVRRNPSSRQYGFSRSALDLACQSVGILYRHFPELGVSPESRGNPRTQDDFETIYQGFVREGLPQHDRVLSEISAWIRAGERVALTCYDRDPGRSHRRCIAGVLERHFGIRTATVHL
jgi:hypothetical protein